MKVNSRTQNARMNIFYGYIAQAGIIILSFVGRRIFLRFLAIDYLGINGLYSNILTILSLPELGIDAAVVYSLYKPVAEDDKELVRSLVAYFRKIYCILAFGVFAVGVMLIPFLEKLITSDLPTSDLVLYYVLFLIDTVASYFVAHKVALLSASQEQRVQKLVTLCCNLLLQILHIIVLLIWKNYYVYIAATVITTILTNTVLGIAAERLHPEVFEKKETVAIDKKPIRDRIFSTFLYKIGVVLINSTDNILISVLVSTVAVGYYSNYYTVTTAVTGFITIITTSLVAGIGNLAAKGTNKEQSDLFDMVLFFYHAVAAMGLIGFSLLFNDLITLWLGEEYLFDSKTVFIIALNFYLANAISPVWMFREANGMFQMVKYLLLIRAGLNIVFSIWFGMLWGVFGIFLATAVSLVLSNFWYEPRILSKYVLQRSQWMYWGKQAKYCLTTMVCYGLSYLAIRHFGNSIPLFIGKTGIVCLITGSVFLILNFKTPEFKKLKSYLKTDTIKRRTGSFRDG